MNQISEVIATLINYKSIVRDTLEYTLENRTFKPELFEARKKALLVEIEENTPLRNIIKNSKENGTKFEEAVRDLHETVYGEDSTIIKNADDGLRVDYAQRIEIFKRVIPVHENLEAMVRGLIRDAHNKNVDVAKADTVDRAEEALYRSVSYFVLVHALNKFYSDYVQARVEAKGAETPASKFIADDIAEIVKGLNTIKLNNQNVTFAAFKDAEEKIFRLSDMITGRREIVKGTKMDEVQKDTEQTVFSLLAGAEKAYVENIRPFMEEFVAQAKKDGGRIVGDDHAAPVAEGPIEAEIEGEIDPATGRNRKA